MPFEITGTTADVALKVWGGTAEEFFTDAARGMFAIMLEGGVEGWPATHRVELESPDPESLLVDWLGELLYLFDVKKFVFETATFDAAGPEKLSCTVSGTQYRGTICGTEIKAVTHHMLEIASTAAGYETTIIFDL